MQNTPLGFQKCCFLNLLNVLSDIKTFIYNLIYVGFALDLLGYVHLPVIQYAD